MMRPLFFLLTLPSHLISKPVETFYGTLEVEEEVIHALIESPAMQRLKELHQYGIFYYLSGCEEYYRYEHSLGVFAILRMNGCSLEEQIAGLLHDASHTAFCHGSDYFFFPKDIYTSYQDTIHEWYLEQSGLAAILQRYGYSPKDVLHKSGMFRALEQELPNLCADRIDYNLQGAFLRGNLSYEEVESILADLTFDGELWVASDPEKVRKLAAFSLEMSLHCWSAPENQFWNTHLSACLHRLLEQGEITFDDIHFGTDKPIFKRLVEHADPLIQKKMREMFSFFRSYRLSPSEEGDLHFPIKFRGVNPWIKTASGVARLTALSPEFNAEYESVKEQSKRGWNLLLNDR